MTKITTEKYRKTQANSLGFLFWCKWVLSYLWPVKVISEARNGDYIELVLFKGERLLNSKNANYSNGNLQLAFSNLFKEVPIQLNNRSNVLILGYGFGGVASLIKQYNPKAEVVGVEHNALILDWYKTYCKPIENVTIHLQDAREFVAECSVSFDVVICDLYNDLNVPSYFQTNEFVEQLANLLNNTGVVVYNKVVQTESHKSEMANLLISFSNLFKGVQVNEQFGLNRFIIAQNKT